MKKMIQNKKFSILFLIIVIVCFLYLGSRVTYTAYESEIGTTVDNAIAGMKVYINGMDVVTDSDVFNSELILEGVTWNSTHTREGKISPGSSGTIHLVIDATESDVAVRYEFTFIDKLVDSTKDLTFGTMTCDGTYIRTGENVYTGVITRDDIANGDVVHLDIDFYFDSTVDIEGFSGNSQNYDDLFNINLRILQYTGETITPYVESP